MAIYTKEALEKYNEILKEHMFDTVSFGACFISFGKGEIEHIKFEDVFISCYQSLLNSYQSQSSELRACNNLES